MDIPSFSVLYDPLQKTTPDRAHSNCWGAPWGGTVVVRGSLPCPGEDVRVLFSFLHGHRPLGPPFGGLQTFKRHPFQSHTGRKETVLSPRDGLYPPACTPRATATTTSNPSTEMAFFPLRFVFSRHPSIQTSSPDISECISRVKFGVVLQCG
jgi:hypothetical protein